MVYQKPMTGMGRKPDDKWALPLKHSHHMAQHDHGDELGWWSAHGVKDPFALCMKYYARFGGDGGEPVKRRRAKTKDRNRPKQKIPSRPFQKIKRSFR